MSWSIKVKLGYETIVPKVEGVIGEYFHTNHTPNNRSGIEISDGKFSKHQITHSYESKMLKKSHLIEISTRSKDRFLLFDHLFVMFHGFLGLFIVLEKVLFFGPGCAKVRASRSSKLLPNMEPDLLGVSWKSEE